MNYRNLIFKTNNNDIKIAHNDILFFIDDTGDSNFSDDNHPVFGLGGCGMHASHYTDKVRIAWNYMKDKFFNGSYSNLHASKLNPNPDQLDALTHFFTKFEFFKVCSITSNKAFFNSGHPPIQIICESLKCRMLDVLKWSGDFSKLFIVFEHGTRTTREIEKWLTNFNQLKRRKKVLNVVKMVMPKSAIEPGLEIADFIMQASGAQTRNRIKSGLTKEKRKDFKLIWETGQQKGHSFMEIVRTEINPGNKSG